jgi:hypothetical protein
MQKKISSILCVLVFVIIFSAEFVEGVLPPSCNQGIQGSGSIYLICEPVGVEPNGSLVIWAHGFQDAGTPVGIPENQLFLDDDISIPGLVTSLGFYFATNSYSKTGLAVVEGAADILDLVGIYKNVYGEPDNIFLVGASEGGIITALLVERTQEEIFKAGLALCGPVGDFPFQINYFGNARVTFQYFFPGLLPQFTCSENQAPVEDWCNLDEDPAENWDKCFDERIKPTLFNPHYRSKLDQWVAVARLPFDSNNYLESVEEAARDVLRFSVVNVADAVETLGGFPFENRGVWYRGSKNDFLLNIFVKRCRANPAAIDEMKMNYNTTGMLPVPLITMHTLKDQQIPYIHEIFYNLKTFFQRSYLTKHVNIPVDRFGHCNFTLEEALFSFSLMLLYSGDLDLLSGVGDILQGSQLETFSQMAEPYGMTYEAENDSLEALEE